MFLRMWLADHELPPESMFVVYIAVSLSLILSVSPTPPNILPQFIKFILASNEINHIWVLVIILRGRN